MLSLPSNLTLREAHATLRDLEPAIAASGDALITIDAASLQQIDTSALAVLLECQRLAAGLQRRLQVINVPARLAELADLYGVRELIDLQPRA
jgi:phospholipid transport system transporter-binding protein